MENIQKENFIMNIYIDESGSINNHSNHERYFVIALINITDKKKVTKAYKRFVSGNTDRLKELDKDKFDNDGNMLREGGKMFCGDTFKELKGAQFDREMKIKFAEHFIRYGGLEVYYIQLDNAKLSDGICDDIATAFNYPLKLALEYFIKNGFIAKEDIFLQLDERNEKTNKKYFLQQYLNTELRAKGITNGKFEVTYFDSSNNKFIQIADVFANLYYSELMTRKYSNVFAKIKSGKILKFIFKFPL